MKSATIELNAERILGKVLVASVRKEPLKLRCLLNDKEGNNNRPDYKSSDGISIWLNDGDSFFGDKE